MMEERICYENMAAAVNSNNELSRNGNPNPYIVHPRA